MQEGWKALGILGCGCRANVGECAWRSSIYVSYKVHGIKWYLPLMCFRRLSRGIAEGVYRGSVGLAMCRGLRVRKSCCRVRLQDR